MSSHVFRTFEVEPLQQGESVIDISSDDTDRDQSDQRLLQSIQLPQIFLPWTPPEKLNTLKSKFELYILAQYPCLPCSHCGWMMYPEKSKWIAKDNNLTYPLTRAYPDLPFTFNPNPPDNRIPACDACHRNQSRNYPPYLRPIPPEIESIPLWK